MEVIAPIPEHNILLLLCQLGTILVSARLLGELFSRVGQPAVLGELLAGIILGPSILGQWAPGLQAALFPADRLAFRLLEALSWFGMVFLLFLVGGEVDVRLLRRLGKPALSVVACDLAVCAAAGAALGRVLPDHFLGTLGDRGILTLFMAVAVSITAVPVLAKILLDLDLLKRNIGLTALGAGLVEDLIGWTALSVVLDMAHRGVGSPLSAGRSLGVTLLFLGGAWTVGRWAVRWLFRLVDERLRLSHRRVTLAAALALAGAAVTQAIGIHAVFGAFVAGVLATQAPRFRPEDRETLEGMTHGIFAPLFFSFAGLQVRLHELKDWDMLAIVLTVAVGGKLLGCYIGGRVGGFRRTEAVALGVGMNARGAMELVLALLGLSAGIISQPLYSIVVMTAVVTTLGSPLLLRLMAPFLPLSEEETERLRREAREARSLFSKGDLKVLMPTAGGPSAAGLLSLAAPLARAKRLELSALMVREPGRSLKESLLRTMGWDPLSMDFQAAAAALKQRAESFGLALSPRIVTRESREDAVLEEAARGYGLMLLGTHQASDPLGGAFLAETVAESPCHVGIYRAGLAPPPGPVARILLPTKGDPLFPFVFEFAALYAETAPDCTLTVLHVSTDGRGGWNPFSLLMERESGKGTAMGPLVAEALQQHTQTAGGKALNLEQKTAHGNPAAEGILREAAAGKYDLILLAGVKSLVRERLFFGHTIAELLRRAPCPVLVLTPARGGFGLLSR